LPTCSRARSRLPEVTDEACAGAGRAVGRVAVAVPVLAGCGASGLYGAPLARWRRPGKPAVPRHRAVRRRAGSVPQASVRLNDVAVGKVEQISLAPDGAVALVSAGGQRRRGTAHQTLAAELSSASLLGRSSSSPGVARARPEGTLRDGAVIPIASTRRYPEVEEVFGALSLLLNGGRAWPSSRTSSTRSTRDQRQRASAAPTAQSGGKADRAARRPAGHHRARH